MPSNFYRCPAVSTQKRIRAPTEETRARHWTQSISSKMLFSQHSPAQLIIQRLYDCFSLSLCTSTEPECSFETYPMQSYLPQLPTVSAMRPTLCRTVFSRHNPDSLALDTSAESESLFTRTEHGATRASLWKSATAPEDGQWASSNGSRA